MHALCAQGLLEPLIAMLENARQGAPAEQGEAQGEKEKETGDEEPRPKEPADLQALLSARDERGRTPLGCGVIGAHEGIVAELLRAGADPTEKDDKVRDFIYSLNHQRHPAGKYIFAYCYHRRYRK